MKRHMTDQVKNAILKFDINGDNKFDFAEYEAMCHKLEPNFDKKFIMGSYKDAVGQDGGD